MAYRPSTLAAMSAALGFVLLVPMGPAAATAEPTTDQRSVAGNRTQPPTGAPPTSRAADPGPATPAPSAPGALPTTGTHPTAAPTTGVDPGLIPSPPTGGDPPGTPDPPNAVPAPPADAAAPAGLSDQGANPHQGAGWHRGASHGRGTDPDEAAQPSLATGSSRAPSTGAEAGQAPQSGSRPRVAAGGTIESPPVSPDAVDAAGWTSLLSGRETGIRIFFAGLVALIFSIAGLVTVAIRRRMW